MVFSPAWLLLDGATGGQMRYLAALSPLDDKANEEWIEGVAATPHPRASKLHWRPRLSATRLASIPCVVFLGSLPSGTMLL